MWCWGMSSVLLKQMGGGAGHQPGVETPSEERPWLEEHLEAVVLLVGAVLLAQAVSIMAQEAVADTQTCSSRNLHREVGPFCMFYIQGERVLC